MIKSLDHVVLTTRDLDKCLAFYVQALGMRLEKFGEGRIALKFGDQKFNVHPPGLDTGIRATYPTPGSLDLCFLADCPLDDVIARLKKHDIPIELGPVTRNGARFPIRSVYVRDPDANLVEISVPAETTTERR
jgi:catechol 2,3-dioxygenase-like lactoylglutathione lyase family enzyme